MTESRKRMGRPSKGTPPEESPPLPGTGPIREIIDAPANVGGLIAPVAPDDELIAAFKRYVSLKDKLLEPSDYTWHVKWKLGDKEQRKVFIGLTGEATAKKFAENLKRQKIEPEVEKRVRKSGCFKLSKAFGISVTILDFYENREQGAAIYKVRATAPNGQQRERTGSCDRKERGKADMPFDNISATANTRAEDRAIMALLGGENTSEEFEEHESEEKDAPPQTPQKPSFEPKTCPTCGTIFQGVGTDALCPPCSRLPAEERARLEKLSPEERQRLRQIDEKFVRSKPAAQDGERQKLNRRLWAALGTLFPEKETAERKIRATVSGRYKKSSIKDLSDQEFRELTEGIEKVASQKKG